VSVGDGAAVAGQAALQTHLFEDRVMKMAAVTVGADCVVGSRAVVLYDAVLEAGSELEALSLAMKGETLPAGTRWRGIPSRPAQPCASGPAPEFISSPYIGRGTL